ncbi:YdbL family protein [Altererythrobacter sp. KTW20L]|uniref:YdbL family protein n=1 Tax=Altererythrobacter sp. KTW20L TaxID=2942210 RepID=UPI0020C0C4B3|nr:YdbL family protein [Altererythrobacter sp. KTW20L]MCL6251812.1 YdbL family protein [Altererythrobacter sp. KTW20L]
MMIIDSKYRKVLGTAATALLLAGLATPVLAQRDPAYAAAREAGQVGERVNGYLGIVGNATPELQRVVDDINNQRRQVYTQRAQAEGATLEQYALTAGCLAIARTTPGEKYQAPDGTWQTRTAAAPVRDPRCP